jgi:hypothetical protein
LQAQDIGRPLGQEPANIVDPQSDRVDVPGDDAQLLPPVEMQRRPVGGEDRAPACQKRLGEIGPAGETGPF